MGLYYTRRYAIGLGLMGMLLLVTIGCAQSSPTTTAQPTATPQPTVTPDPRIDEVLRNLDKLEQRVTKNEELSSASPTPNPIPTPTPTPVPTASPTPKPPPTPAGGDTTPPAFVEVSFNPSRVNVSRRNAFITFTVRVTEDLSGLDRVAISYSSPSGRQNLRAFFPPGILEAGPQEVLYNPTMIVPRFSEGGTWVMDWAYVRDRVGNRKNYEPDEFAKLGFPTSFDVVYEE